MSLILKGIDIPKKGTIKLEIEPNGTVWAEGKDWQSYTESAIQIPKGHGRLKDFDGDGIHPVIVDGVYMVKVDDLNEMPTILEAEE